MLLLLTNKQIKGFLFAVEGVGAVFVSLFIIVYLAGLSRLPNDVVYHSEPAFRMPLSIIGVVLVALALVALVLTVVINRKKEN
jgi:hypothetical protein